MKQTLTLVLLLLTFASCKKEDGPSFEDQRSDMLTAYSDLVLDHYADSKTAASQLREKLLAFTSNPTETSLQEAKAAWIEARKWYTYTEAFRFYGGPIDGEEGPEGAMNGWPLDESYIDYVDGNPTAGIIQNPSLLRNLSADSLLILNERGGETNLSTGYHAIEFLLWGQDLNDNGPGNRPVSDFQSGNAWAERRKQYLLILADLLIEQHQEVMDAWAPNANNFRKDFLATPKISLNKILNGLKELSGGELAGERMEVALVSQAQEDEQSCFSDNTHHDHLYDLDGIAHLYSGTYSRISGSNVTQASSLGALVQSKNKTLHQRILSELATTRTAILAIPVPFDQALKSADGKAKIQTAISALRQLEVSFQESFDLLNP